jgi:hypothetical protein
MPARCYICMPLRSQQASFSVTYSVDDDELGCSLVDCSEQGSAVVAQPA